MNWFLKKSDELLDKAMSDYAFFNYPEWKIMFLEDLSFVLFLIGKCLSRFSIS